MDSSDLQSNDVTDAQKWEPKPGWVYYPCASGDKCPDVSFYRLPPDLDFPINLCLYSSGSIHSAPVIVEARAFELCTSFVLGMSVNFYFARHIFGNMNRGHRVEINTATIVIVLREQTLRGEGGDTLIQTHGSHKIPGALTAGEDGQDDYHDTFMDEVARGRLEAVNVYAEWTSEQQIQREQRYYEARHEASEMARIYRPGMLRLGRASAWADSRSSSPDD